jgi:hypothetical protein
VTELASQLLELRDDPPRAGEWAARCRGADDEVRIAAASECTAAGVAHIERDGAVRALDQWPNASLLRRDDLVTVQVPASSAPKFCEYLSSLARALADVDPSRCPTPFVFAPWCAEPQGIHRLWTVAAARIALPPSVHVGARHDLLGIRVAQVALGFGASALVGPIEPDRSLPLAGVTRPTENTRAGLRALVEQVGLHVQGSPPPAAN